MSKTLKLHPVTIIIGLLIFSNLFGINVSSGNDVSIIDEVNPFNASVTGYLDIHYSMPTINNVSIDSKTGVITLTGSVNVFYFLYLILY